MNLWGSDFFDSGDPMIIFSDSRDPNRDPKTPLKEPCLCIYNYMVYIYIYISVIVQKLAWHICKTLPPKKIKKLCAWNCSFHSGLQQVFIRDICLWSR